MEKKNPHGQVGAGYMQALGKLYSSNDTPPPPAIEPGSIVTVDLIPGERLEVLRIENGTALLRLANGATLRAGLERVREVAKC